ncbi:MAG: hypothetical protein JXB18_01275, partial [Sedimentisphaerales bacterium]|nr:hypothetical protein [Sedimentisphaerales bacterium]
MCLRNMSVIITILFVLGCSSFGAVYTDTFDVDHNYLAGGTSGTVWDGFVYNDGTGATQNAVVSVAAATGGGLNLKSRNGNWEQGDDDGVLLYIDVPAGHDFVAEVYVSGYTYVNYHDVGLMARVAGTKDYVMHRHFGAFGINNRIRSTNDGITDNNFPSSATLSPYLQLEKAGPLFTIRVSSDGITYTPVGSVSRGDMIGVPLQVGLYQATFSNNTGNVKFDDFSIDIYEEGPIEKTTYWPNDFNNYPEVTAELSAESDNFVIYWGEKCGLDPTTASEPWLRFNPSDVLAMLEGFYDTYINQLGFLDDSLGNISLYKFILVMNDTWNNGNWGGWAFGAHYDNVIGAMWIHPAGCQPPSGVVAHEFAHALQCQSFI